MDAAETEAAERGLGALSADLEGGAWDQRTAISATRPSWTSVCGW
jgi:hypothetical protein